MNKYNLYGTAYTRLIKRNINMYKTFIFILFFSMIGFAVASIILSEKMYYQGLLYLNIPFDIICLFSIFIFLQVYLPNYNWEYNMSQKAQTIAKKTIEGKILSIEQEESTYDNQRMITILIQLDDSELKLHLRPWFVSDVLQEDASYLFSVVSRVIVTFEEVTK